MTSLHLNPIRGSKEWVLGYFTDLVETVNAVPRYNNDILQVDPTTTAGHGELHLRKAGFSIAGQKYIGSYQDPDNLIYIQVDIYYSLSNKTYSIDKKSIR